MRARVKICRVVRTWIEDGKLWQQLECGDVVDGRVSPGGTIAKRRQCQHCSWARYLAAQRETERQRDQELDRVETELGLRR